MIDVRGLTKRYRDLAAIEDVSFSVAAGEIVGFLGPNGAGKSTTMRILTGCIPATAGSVRVNGFDVFEDPHQVKRCIGYLPEVPPLYPDLTALEQLQFVAALKGIRGRQARAEIDRVVQRAAVGDQLSRLVGNLSKGYRQRVGIALALLGDPKVLILDEPTVGLDPKQIGEVRGLIKNLAGDHTVVLSTHILPEVTMTCQRALIIAAGRIVADDTIDRLAASHGGKSLEEIFLSLTSH
ncbi:MAG: ABC transporter ATP-binding protein [Deltaproteobacteria bacterium]|nr:ABC transporter ATP-binding protein [Deltaproteobacteria bacterium]